MSQWTTDWESVHGRSFDGAQIPTALKQAMRELANEAWHAALNSGNGDSIVACDYCGARRSVYLNHCLEKGWPKCCGYDMRLE